MHPHTPHTPSHPLTPSHPHIFTQVVWSLLLRADRPVLVTWVVGMPALLSRGSSDPLPSQWRALYRTLSGQKGGGVGGGEEWEEGRSGRRGGGEEGPSKLVFGTYNFNDIVMCCSLPHACTPVPPSHHHTPSHPHTFTLSHHTHTHTGC